MAPVIDLLGDELGIIHTGQHFDTLMSDVFMAGLGVPDPIEQLAIGGRDRDEQIAEGRAALAATLERNRPAFVLAQGDTNSVAAAALACSDVGIPFCHIEAGLRSFDMAMPEEHNRILADQLADLLFAPTDTSRDNLAAEGIAGDQVIVTGNTVVDALLGAIPSGSDRQTILDSLDAPSEPYVLVTIHRPENVDDPATLERVIQGLGDVAAPMVFPIHPRTKRALDALGVSLPPNIEPLEPVAYREFLALSAGAAVLISDSGGVQEEVSIYKRPVVVVRRSTERPEVLGTFATLVDPGEPMVQATNGLLADLDAVHERLAAIPSPYGDGHAAQRIVGALRRAAR